MTKYQAVFFDLDGTLLPMEGEVFIKRYFEALPQFLVDEGFEDPRGIVAAVNEGTKAMFKPHEGLNSDVFWHVFEETCGFSRAEFEPVMERFYASELYGSIGCDVEEFADGLEALRILREKGYPLYLTTLPVFPLQAVEARLSWSGIDPEAFGFITTYDTCCATKPSLSYYRQCVERSGVSDPSQVLMVGNNTSDDLAILELGCDAYLVTDFLINGNDYDIAAVKHGTFKDFCAFAKALPALDA